VASKKSRSKSSGSPKDNVADNARDAKKPLAQDSGPAGAKPAKAKDKPQEPEEPSKDELAQEQDDYEDGADDDDDEQEDGEDEYEDDGEYDDEEYEDDDDDEDFEEPAPPPRKTKRQVQRDRLRQAEAVQRDAPGWLFLLMGACLLLMVGVWLMMREVEKAGSGVYANTMLGRLMGQNVDYEAAEEFFMAGHLRLAQEHLAKITLPSPESIALDKATQLLMAAGQLLEAEDPAQAKEMLDRFDDLGASSAEPDKDLTDEEREDASRRADELKKKLESADFVGILRDRVKAALDELAKTEAALKEKQEKILERMREQDAIAKAEAAEKDKALQDLVDQFAAEKAALDAQKEKAAQERAAAEAQKKP
jgi:hypothetical protein